MYICSTCRHRTMRDYAIDSSVKIKLANARLQGSLKEVVIRHYSPEGKCQNPICEVPGGARNVHSLSMDHINGGGSQHVKVVGNLYRWLITHNFPEGFQVLCMNCQFVKRHEKKEFRKGKLKPLTPSEFS